MNTQWDIKTFRLQYVVVADLVGYTRGMEKPRLPDFSKRESAEHQEAWRVEEIFSEARSEAKGSEDGYLISDHVIAVFDGVSTENGKQQEGTTPGQFAVETVTRAFASNSTLRADEAVRVATEALRVAAKEQGIERAALVFVAFFPKENRIVRVGDCSFLIDGVGHNPGIVPDRAKAELRRRIIERALESGMSAEEVFRNDPARPRVSSLRVWQETHANNPDAPDFGYGVVNGTDIPEMFVDYISVPAGTKSVILASDGYPTESLRGTLAETEEALHGIEQRDPLGISETKSVRMNMPRRDQAAADDRTYIKIVP